MRVLKENEVKAVSGGFFFKLFVLKKLFGGFGHKAPKHPKKGY
jgi:hypothetical protein